MATTKENALRAQEECLASWKRLLKDNVYLALEIFARRHNDNNDTANCVLRGVTLSNFVQNYHYYIETDQLKDYLGMFGYERYLKETSEGGTSKLFYEFLVFHVEQIRFYKEISMRYFSPTKIHY